LNQLNNILCSSIVKFQHTKQHHLASAFCRFIASRRLVKLSMRSWFGSCFFVLLYSRHVWVVRGSFLLGSMLEVSSFHLGKTLSRLPPQKKSSLSSVPVPIHPELLANHDLREEHNCYCCRISAGPPKKIEIRALLCPIVVFLFEWIIHSRGETS